MTNEKYAYACAEFLYYLKGIKKTDIDKIPKKLMEHIKLNASKKYVCKFDYKKPLKDLNLMDETKSLIGAISYNFWCKTDEEKKALKNKFIENEKNYQKQIQEKYSIERIFAEKNKFAKEKEENNVAMVEYKEHVVWYKKFIATLKNIFIRKRD